MEYPRTVKQRINSLRILQSTEYKHTEYGVRSTPDEYIEIKPFSYLFDFRVGPGRARVVYRIQP